MRSFGSFVLALAVALLAFVPLNSQTKNNQTPEAPKPPTLRKPKPDEIDPNEVIRINITLVNSPVLIIGRDGKFVPNLRREDFQIFEDGVPQEITYFATVEKPFTVALLIDTSRSTILELQDIQSAAVSFVEKMRTNDRVMVISFSSEINILAEPTSDREVLLRAIRASRPGGSSRIYDVVSFVLAERLERLPGRTAVVLFSDGVDNSSREATYESTLQRIERTQTLIYPVQFSTYDHKQKGSEETKAAFGGSGFTKQDYIRADTYLHQAAAVSGTGVYPAQDISDLDKAVAAIVDELHNEYSVGYYPRSPVEPGRERRIEVKTRLPQLKVRSRTSYSLEPSGSLTRIPTGPKPAVASDANTIGASPLRRESDIAAPKTDARWSCKGTDAPTDSVVAKEGFVSHCPKSERPNDQTNAWFVKKPEMSEVMCKGFMMWRGKEMAGAPIPTGYIVTSETASTVCAKSNDAKNPNNAWQILKPSSRATMCKGFAIPRGFVSERETKVPGCPAKLTETNAWIIRPRD